MKPDVWVPDGLAEEAAFARTTHMGVVAHPDDLEAIESCQDSFRSREVEWSDFSRGMRRDPELMDELPIRAFWRQWHAQIMGHQKAARVDDLRLAGNGRALAAK